MIVVLKKDATPAEIQQIEKRIRAHGNEVKRVHGVERNVLCVLGTIKFDRRDFERLPGVAEVLAISKPFKLASRETKTKTTVHVGDVEIGGPQVVIMAGPCAVENRPMLLEAAKRISELGVTVLRGGAFKPRTSPYSFQGMGLEGLKLLSEARKRYGLKIITEVMTPEKVDVVAKYADILQVGARNMQNFDLLKAVSKVKKPVMLKRGLAATIDEWLQSAEYILAGGNYDVILCERGIRTFETTTRNTLDVNAIPVLRRLTHLPIVVDPSHGTGVREYVTPMALSAIAAGADGIMVEVHPEPEKALSDGPQSLRVEQLERLVAAAQAIAPVVGRTVQLTHHLEHKEEFVRSHKGKRDRLHVAFQGEHGAFSEEAIRQFFGSRASSLPCKSFLDAFEAVQTGRCAYGVIPIENSLTGSISQTYDLLLEFDLPIVGEVLLKVSHNLIAHKGTQMSDIEIIYAHPQAAMQCDAFLRSHKEWEVMLVYDTAGSVKMIKERQLHNAAAIASKAAAEKWEMQILKEGIESSPRNFTRFVVISKSAPRHQTGNKMSLAFTAKNEPGALANVVDIFKEHGINMTKLESRPLLGAPWEYMFYVDIEADPNNQLVASALSDVKKHTQRLKVLGSYRAA